MSLSAAGNRFGAFLSRNSKKILILLIAFVVVSIVAVGITWWVYKDTESDALVMVGNEEITQDDLDRAMYGLSFSNDLSIYSQEDKDKRLEQLIEFAIARKEAETRGITVSETELDKYIKEALGDSYTKYNEAQKLQTREMSRNSLLLEKVKKEAIGWREANYLVVNFHKFFSTLNTEYQVEGMGDEDLIKKSKENALLLATELSDKLKNGELTFEEAKKELYENKEFGVDALLPRTPDMGGTITKDDFIEDTLDEETINILANLNKGDVSDPVVDTISTKEFGSAGTEYRYFIYQVTDIGGSEYPTYDKWLTAMKLKYGVTKNNPLSFMVSRAYAEGVAQCPNTCSSDNAELYIETEYVAADGTVGALSATDIINVTGGGTPWATNDGSYCLSPDREGAIAGSTDGNGHWSSCENKNRSYYCASSSVMFLEMLRVSSTSLPGTDPAQGRWTWEHQEAANNYPSFPVWDGSPYTGGSSFYDPDGVADYMALLNLRYGRNVQNTGYNGKRVKEVFRWHPFYINNTPAPVAVSACNGADCDGTLALGSNGLTPVTLTAKATDADADKVATQVVYRMTSPTTSAWYDFGTGIETGSEPVSYGTGGYVANGVYLSAKPADINSFGWRPMTGDSAPNSTQSTEIALPSVYLPAGTYEWKVRAVDEHLLYSGWSSVETFTISSPPPALSCTVTPETGLSPLVVKVTAISSGLGVNPVFSYNFGDGSAIQSSRPAVVYYTYSGAGSYQVTVSNPAYSSGSPVSCIPSSITVTDPADGDGGEIQS